jgi:prepilin-type N-terminal cleavage/methylation domain-containing protein
MNRRPSSFSGRGSAWGNSGVRPGADDSTPTVRRAGKTAGFTLVELLVVITIILILAGITLGALQGARQAAREAQTRATITKINNFVMKQFNSYSTRRVPLSDFAVQLIASNFNGQFPNLHKCWDPAGQSPAPGPGMPPGTPTPPNAPPNWNVAAFIRLVALRDIMRMEMPSRLNDVIDPPIFANAAFTAACTSFGCGPLMGPPPPSGGQWPPGQEAGRPALSKMYYARYQAALTRTLAKYPDQSATVSYRDQGTDRIGRYDSSECLYMIVMLSSPDAASQFHGSEIGDTDDDGLPEFLDGWGDPIKFFLWAPGFTSSDLQTSFATAAPSDMQSAAEYDHDPFDTHQVDIYGWRLVPLIYSAGRDGIYDLNLGLVDTTDPNYPFYHYSGSPYFNRSGVFNQIGLPTPLPNISPMATDPPAPPDPQAGPQWTPTTDCSVDNIHTHTNLEAR